MKTKELVLWLESKDLMEDCVESKVYDEIIKRLEELEELKDVIVRICSLMHSLDM